VCLTPDGAWVMSGSKALDGTVRVNAPGNGKLPELDSFVQTATDKVTAIGRVRVWDTTTGYLVERLENPDGHKDSVYSVAFAPNGEYTCRP
jgi:WD40 repeat protein